MSTLVVLQSMIVIFALILVGMVLTKMGVITNEGAKTISFLVVNICNPLYLIFSVMKGGADIPLGSIILAFLVVAILYACMILLGWILPILFRIPREQHRYYAMMTTYCNVGLIGIPVVSFIVGPGALVYVTIVNIVYNLLFYTHGTHTLLKGTGKTADKVTWKTFMNVGFLGAVLALLLVVFHVQLPSMVKGILNYAGSGTTFLAMLVLGVSLAKLPFKKIFSSPRMICFFLVRLIAFPMAVALVLQRVSSYTFMNQALVILMGMPAGNFPLMLATEKGLDTDILATGTILATILSLVTIPIVSLAL